MQRQRARPSNLVAQARDGLCPWKTVRKHAMRLYRDGTSAPRICQVMVVSRQWFHKWHRRWEASGRKWHSLDDRSCRPHTIKSKRHDWQHRILQIRQEHGYGAQKIRHVGNIPLSHTTVHRVLQQTAQARRIPYKQRKYRRFCRPYANYLWQLDTCQINTKNDGWVYIQTLLDDHSRFILSSRTTNYFPTQADTIQLVKSAIAMWGRPLQILTDNGNEFHHTGREEPGLFTQYLYARGTQHIRGRPNHPRTQGKIERWHRSLKEWMARRPKAPDHPHLRTLLLQFIEHYNLERPHVALRMRTPAEVHLESLMVSQSVARLVNEVP